MAAASVVGPSEEVGRRGTEALRERARDSMPGDNVAKSNAAGSCAERATASECA